VQHQRKSDHVLLERIVLFPDVLTYGIAWFAILVTERDPRGIGSFVECVIRLRPGHQAIPSVSVES
jgi:hypothetical protein